MGSTRLSKADTPRENRGRRLKEQLPGAWGSSSQDYVRLATELYESSAKYAARHDGNVSVYAIAGIPLLVSTLRVLLVEANAGLFGSNRQDSNMMRLANDPNEVQLISEVYLSGDANKALVSDLKLLVEVRNELVHPAHTPAGTTHNTPENMLRLRREGLLQTTGNESSDYMWLAQLQSHCLFRWAFQTVAAVAHEVIRRHYVIESQGQSHFQCYQRFTSYDLCEFTKY